MLQSLDCQHKDDAQYVFVCALSLSLQTSLLPAPSVGELGAFRSSQILTAQQIDGSAGSSWAGEQ
jgi:hypothetical protein